MNQQSWKIWSNFVCPLGPFLLAQSHIVVLVLTVAQYNQYNYSVPYSVMRLTAFVSIQKI